MKKLLLSTCLLALSLPAHAYRCGNYLIQVGDFNHDVATNCGQPSGIYPFSRQEWWGNQYVIVGYERWIYRNYGKRDGVILFRNGRVSNITEGERN